MGEVYRARDLGMSARYGAAWQNATSILAPRVFKLGAQVSF